MELRPIKTETNYQEALEEIEFLFNAPPNTVLLNCNARFGIIEQ